MVGTKDLDRRRAARARARWLIAMTLAFLLLLPAAAAQAGEIVSLGDSYSSGEGVAPYDSGTDGSKPKCHRSKGAWPRLIGVSKDHHLACSGAVWGNVDGRGRGKAAPDDVDQLTQLRRIASNTPIQRVVLTIGGNDAGFGPLLRNCYIAGRLRHPGRCLGNLGALQKTLTSLRVDLARTYRKVADTAGAPVLVAGYPDLFPQGSGRAQLHCSWLYPSMQKRAAKMTGMLEATLKGAAADAGVDFVSMRGVLAGHELCTGRSYIRAIAGKPGDLVGDQQQGHPLKEGQVLMALRVLRWLRQHQRVCTPASEVAAIVDDSGSMDENDPANIRGRALELLLTKPTNAGRTFGAVEFGGTAGTLFGPGLVGPNQAAMLEALGALQADGYDGDDGTDYNAAFAASRQDQPSPGARIFLTDGRNNAEPYEDGHAGGPPTYVIGLNIGPDDGTDEPAALLGRIASETGGAYFPLLLSPGDSAETQVERLQPALNEIDTRIGCTNVQAENTVTLNVANQPTSTVKTLFDGQPAMEIVATWADPQVQVNVSGMTVADQSGTVVADLTGTARIAKSKKALREKLVVSSVNGQTFSTITVKRPRKGRLLAVSFAAPVLTAPTALTVQLRPVAVAPTQSGSTGVSTPSAPDPVAPTPTTPAPTTPAPPPDPVRVNAYDNYGGGAAGRAMCRGNPGNGASMPGGTATQTFTVPAGVASIDHALVQIDPDGSVVGHATLSVNGVPKANADATASGDTHFSFPSVAVQPGDAVSLSIAFTASSGKIITVYTVGSPGGTFTASNGCPAGAPSLSTGATGLRAVLSGFDR